MLSGRQPREQGEPREARGREPGGGSGPRGGRGGTPSQGEQEGWRSGAAEKEEPKRWSQGEPTEPGVARRTQHKRAEAASQAGPRGGQEGSHRAYIYIYIVI